MGILDGLLRFFEMGGCRKSGSVGAEGGLAQVTTVSQRVAD